MSSDQTFLASVRACTLPAAAFDHRQHLRLAWLLVREAGGPDRLAGATRAAVRDLRRLTAHYGAAGRFHQTITRAYMACVAAHVRRTPDAPTFDAFAAANGDLFEKRLLASYYSADRLGSAAARGGWVPPDVRPLPQRA